MSRDMVVLPDMNDFWLDKRVFITGANGFLGSHLTKTLIEKGVKPFVLVYEKNPGSIFDQEKLAEKTTVINGDIRDFGLMARTIKENRIDTIFHLAAQAVVDQAIDNPMETLEINARGTWNVLEAARQSGATKRVIAASSDKAYGDSNDLPYKEHTHGLNGWYPYEVSKVCTDLVSQSYWRTFRLPVSITRATNLYGPGDLKLNRIVPQTIQKLFHNEQPVIRNSTETLRDYLFVEDAVAGYLAIAEKMDTDMFGHAFNIATNQPTSVYDAIKIISAQMHKNIEPRIIKTHGMEINHQYASYEKIKERTGWTPLHTFPEGIAKTIPWYLNHFSP